jgi:DNA invertase Pin-like site-specific DNA recombinase
VSGDRQRSTRAGPEAQRGAIAAACRRQRWQLLELVEQIGRSAEEAKRPGIAEPLRLLEAADKQALVAAKRDRLARVLPDLASLLRRLQRGVPSGSSRRKRM